MIVHRSVAIVLALAVGGSVALAQGGGGGAGGGGAGAGAAGASGGQGGSGTSAASGGMAVGGGAPAGPVGGGAPAGAVGGGAPAANIAGESGSRAVQNPPTVGGVINSNDPAASGRPPSGATSTTMGTANVYAPSSATEPQREPPKPAVPCSTSARETDGTTTCIGIDAPRRR